MQSLEVFKVFDIKENNSTPKYLAFLLPSNELQQAVAVLLF